MKLYFNKEMQKWINETYLNDKKISKFSERCLLNKPFPYIVLPRFLKGELADNLLIALKNEAFEEKKSDLFQFKQTKDLVGSKSNILQEFRSLLSSPSFVELISALSSQILQSNSIDLFGSLYEDTDHLLCHDDLLENRKVAFFYYLSDLKKEDGGALSLFSSSKGSPKRIEQRIIPRYNTFAFFIVSNKSFHQVEEMVGKKQRYALSGWFKE
ncbi:2OG-Fe(II) oxygenase [Candidatus Woesearchaeota archaeon]|nr:2OG-Fe(II) oxygenase [Candidatus Woesearchaeota archaeon]